MIFGSSLESRIDSTPLQHIAAPDAEQQYEGVSFSNSGDLLAVAALGSGKVLLFRRRADGLFDETPYWQFGAPDSKLNMPHDVAFSKNGSTELLAVAQRDGAISIYAKADTDDNFGTKPILEISGPDARLSYSDGVAFVPPNNKYLAVSNLTPQTITFYRRLSSSPLRFSETPEFELKHPEMQNPDGLGFSSCGRWMAVANHGNHTVTIFRRRSRLIQRGLAYGPEPVTVIDDAELRHPHSVVFTPRTGHIVATSAGGMQVSMYAPEGHHFSRRWARTPTMTVKAADDESFQEVNSKNKMEGGAKGIAVHANNLAVCSPEFGIKIYSLREASN